MNIHADFSKRVAIKTQEMPWKASPAAGVDRRMLDRIGDEVARATSIVRYAPNSRFPEHVHSGGEEFVVLDGVFQDEHGDWPEGYYIRNPPTSKHTPGSEPGCTIFVKLWQFDLQDRIAVKINMNDLMLTPDPKRGNVLSAILYEDARETVSVEHWAADSKIMLDAPDGAEFLVLNGSFTQQDTEFEKHDWLRVPMGSKLSALSGKQGARIWTKTRHLRFIEAPVVP